MGEQTERNESISLNRRLSQMQALALTVPEIRYLLARLLLKSPVAHPYQGRNRRPQPFEFSGFPEM